MTSTPIALWTLSFQRQVIAAGVAGLVTLPTPDRQGWALLCKPESGHPSAAPIVRIARVLDTYWNTAGPQATPDRTSLDLLLARLAETLPAETAEALRQEWEAIGAVEVGDPTFVQAEVAQRLQRQRLMQYAAQIVDELDRPGDPSERVYAVAEQVLAERDAHAGGAQAETLTVPLSSIKAEPIEWLWPGRIARGKLTLCIGDPKTGKSLVSQDAASRISRGYAWPAAGGFAPLGNIVLLTAEDSAADTVRPRVDALGGDPERIFVLKADRAFSLDRDIVALTRECQRRQPRLIVLDPLSAYFGSKGDAWKDTDVRRTLAPLTKLAETERAAIFAIMHITKASDRRAITRGLGSIAFAAAARIVLVVGHDPNDPSRRFLSSVGGNNTGATSTLAFSIIETPTPVGPQPTIIWETAPVVGVDAEQVLAEPRRPHEQAARQAAMEFLQALFADGSEIEAKVIWQEAKQQGLSRWAVDHAREQLGIRKKLRGFGKDGHWVWVAESKTAKALTAETQTSISSISAGQSIKTSAIPATSTEMLEMHALPEMQDSKTSAIPATSTEMLEMLPRTCAEPEAFSDPDDASSFSGIEPEDVPEAADVADAIDLDDPHGADSDRSDESPDTPDWSALDDMPRPPASSNGGSPRPSPEPLDGIKDGPQHVASSNGKCPPLDSKLAETYREKYGPLLERQRRRSLAHG